jgi:membrane dipeptidase
VILDGHNDLALRTWLGEEPRHIDLATAARAGFAGGFFALFVPGPRFERPDGVPYALPLDEPVPFERARREARELLAVLQGLDVSIARSVEDIVPGRVNAIVHLEGADPLEPDLSDLPWWYEQGVRSIGITWSRPNAFGEGVPFRFPSSPDTGPGLTAAGQTLVHACNLFGVMLDVSHLNEAGFRDVAELTQAPIVATHSNVHALCPSSRNLLDWQLDAIGESDGVVGINFATMFLRSDGGMDTDAPIAEIVRHIDHVASRIGVEHVAFGSDFEGAEMPDELGGAAGLPRLVEALRAAGHDDESLDLITHGNWLRVLGDTWRPWARYFRLAGLDARLTLVDAASRFPEPGFAVDLGAGTGRDTAELLRRGWHVLAIDGEAEAIARLRRLAGGDAARLETQVVRFEDAEWPACDLLNASFSLPFCPPGEFDRVWSRIVGSIVPGGRFAGQLFGDRDAWARTGIVVQSRAEVEALLAPFEIERFQEFEGPSPTVVGKTKQWHVFHVVGRKR